MLIDEIEVPNEAEWELYQGQLFEIWQRLGSNKGDRFPDRPAIHIFQEAQTPYHQTGEKARKELRKTWDQTLEWCKRNHCDRPFSSFVKIPEGKTSSLKPDSSDPYALDRLGRNRDVGDSLIRLLEMQREPFVLAINGKWGCGKTTFLNMWEHHLKDDGFRVVRFNAWENDFAEDPFVSVLCEIEQKLGRTFRAQLEKIASDISRVSLGVLLKALTGGALSKEDFSTEGFADSEEIKTNELLDAYGARKKMVADFKKSLSKAVSEAGGERPLVFIVDELDRCRPTYSIELLERIKHLFDIKEIVFVLALDKEQLGKSIQSVYGDIDTEGYLRRFIDLTYNLPEPSPMEFVQGILKETHLEHYLKKHPGSNSEAPAEWMAGMLDYLAPVWGFSLRDLEHIVRQIGFVVRMLQPAERLYPYLLVPLACLRFHNEELCRKFMKGDLLVGDLLAELPVFVHSRNMINQHRTWALVEAALYILDCNNERGLGGPEDIASSMESAIALPQDVDNAIKGIFYWTGRMYRERDDKLDLINDVHRKLEISHGIS